MKSNRPSTVPPASNASKEALGRTKSNADPASPVYFCPPYSSPAVYLTHVPLFVPGVRASTRMRKSSSTSMKHQPTSSSRPGITQVERQAERRAGGRPPNGGETNTTSRLLRAGRPRVPHHSVVQADCINLRSRRHRFPTLGALVQQLADHFLPRTAQRAGRNAGW